MKKVVWILLLIVSGNLAIAQEQIKKDELYIQTYAKVAVAEMELYKIPASITLAQGILETGNGQSDLAQYGNNHFGIKCKGEWTGDRMYHDDDAKGECFRKYSSALDSYRDHSLFLAERPYYKNLFLLDPKDYKAWAHGLKKAGYATNPKYAYILISLIERYQLNQFDHISVDDVNIKLAELFPNSFKLNINEQEPQVILASVAPEESKKTESGAVFASYQEKEVKTTKKTYKPKTNNFEFPSLRLKFHPNGNLRFVVIKEGDTLEDISKAYGVSVDKLREYNDLVFQKDQTELVINQKIFIEPKKKTGVQKEHLTKEGERMYDIAQNNGVSLLELYKRNLMHPGQEPRIGDKILLKGKKS